MKKLLIIGNGVTGINTQGGIYINDHTAKFLINLQKNDSSLKVSFCQPVTNFEKNTNLLNYNLADTPINFIPLRSKNKFALLIELFLVFFLKLIAFDYIYVFYPNSIGRIVLLLAVLFRKKYGLYVRGEHFIQNKFDKQILRSASFILTVSPSIQNTLRNYNARVEVIRPMIDIQASDFYWKKTFGKEGEKYKALFVGRIESRKGILELIEVARAFNRPESIIQIDFHIVGGGDLYNNLTENNFNLPENIIFYGQIHDRKKLIDLYREADFFIFPSHDEGFPRVLYDAMAQRLPIFTTFVGGIPGYLTDHKTCIQLPLKDPVGQLTVIREALVNMDNTCFDEITKNALMKLEQILMQTPHEKLFIDKINNIL